MLPPFLLHKKHSSMIPKHTETFLFSVSIVVYFIDMNQNTMISILKTNVNDALT